MLAAELKSKINKLWDRFWSGGLANPLTAIEQITYLLFMKRLEDIDNEQLQRSKARKQKYKSMFAKHPEYKWSHWKNLPAEEMLPHVRDKVFPFIKEIQIEDDGEFIRQLKHAAFLIPKPSLLQEAVSIIDGLEIRPQNYDTLGDLYEYLLSELSTAGKVGQFRTPRHIIKMMVELVDPDISDRICDPACGTAGFLVNAYQHILKKYTSKDILKVDKEGHVHNLVGDKIVKKEHWRKLKRETFYGHDFDPTMVRIALMNMIMHGIEAPNITRQDTLSKGYVQKEQYDVILANPPFTGSVDKSDINDKLSIKTTKTELLFLELFYNILETGGRAAIVIPNGVLFGNSRAHKQVRKLLLEQCQMEAVIAMPSGVFQPYSGVGTAILVFTKGGKTKNVWFYQMESDGYTLDAKREYIDGKGDIPDVIKKFSSRPKSDKSFSVSLKEIKENDYNLSPSRYATIEYEIVEYESPSKLVERIMKQEDSIVKELKELKSQLKRYGKKK
ncbi:N-6 DNA methylase [bacterium]|nr:N-6 DNA methylase [bacterium]